MFYILKNNEMTVTVSDLGAELVSAVSADGCEYIWQRDSKYWGGSAPILFPICGRLFESSYLYQGASYAMDLHGFARKSLFSAVQLNETTVCFTLTDTPETKRVYPFCFRLTVEYTLESNRLSSRITVENTDQKPMPATVGLHPGFNVPLDKGDFEDWYLEFDAPCSPDQLILSYHYLQTGRKEAFHLEEGKILRLTHDLFDDDAIFLSRASSSVSLRSEKSQRYVTLSFPEFPYVGFWHKPQSDAPYVCVEPWCGLPSYDGVIDDLEQKSDMFRLLPNEKKALDSSIIFG